MQRLTERLIAYQEDAGSNSDESMQAEVDSEEDAQANQPDVEVDPHDETQDEPNNHSEENDQAWETVGETDQDGETCGEQPTRKSILNLIATKWTEDENLADLSSTSSSQKKKQTPPQPVPGSSSSLTPRSILRSLSYRRLHSNMAIMEINSQMSWRTDSSLYYLRNGRPGPAKLRRRHSDPGNPYEFPNPIDDARAKRDTFPSEEVDPDWRHALQETGKAGHWMMEEFSENHLAERKFAQALAATPEKHLEGCYHGVLRDLNALRTDNHLLAQSQANLTAKLKSLKTETLKLEAYIESVANQNYELKEFLDAQAEENPELKELLDTKPGGKLETESTDS